MVRQLRKYSKEFKEESAKLAISYGNINKAADELGTSPHFTRMGKQS